MDSFDTLAKYYGDKEFFVNFSNVPKLGLNPRSIYKTPIGIYTYPLGAQRVVEYMTKDSFPFAGQRDYIHLMKSNITPIDLSRDDDWDAKMAKIWEANFSYIPFDDRDLAKQRQAEILTNIKWIAQDSAAEEKHGGVFWNFSRILANIIGDGDELKVDTALDLQKLSAEDYSYTSIKNVNAIWTGIFLRAGMESFVDYGSGIIHRNEVYQAVFLNTRSFNLVERLKNPRLGANNVNMITDAHSARKFLGKISSAPDSAKREVILDLAIKGINTTDKTYDDYQVYVNSNPRLTVRYRIAPNIFLPSLAVVLVNAIGELNGEQATSLSKNLIIALYHEISWHFYDEVEIAATPITKALVQLIEACFHGDDKEFVAQLMDMFEKAGGSKYYAGFERTHL